MWGRPNNGLQPTRLSRAEFKGGFAIEVGSQSGSRCKPAWRLNPVPLCGPSRSEGMNQSLDPVERAAALRQEADSVLQEVKLYEIVRPYGQVVPTGSYYLDVMMYPDIDLYISKVSVEDLFDIGSQLAKCEMVYQVVFEKSRMAQLPGGLYLNARIEYGEWGRPWKIDVWSLEDAVIDAKMEEIRRFKEEMTAEVRERILRYKYSVLTENHRTPMYMRIPYLRSLHR